MHLVLLKLRLMVGNISLVMETVFFFGCSKDIRINLIFARDFEILGSTVATLFVGQSVLS